MAFPGRQSAGTLSLDGLTTQVTLAPSGSNVYLQQDTLPADLFASGATLDLSASGDEIPAFSIDVTAVAELEPALPCDVELQADQDLVITWTPAANGARVRWVMNNGLHVGYGPMILCETDDTGEVTVPAAMISRYLSERWIEAESFVLKRYRDRVVELGGGRQVTLTASSSRMCHLN